MPTRPSGIGRESLGEARPNEMNASSASDSDGGSIIGDPPYIGNNWGSMTIDRMNDLVSRYGVSPSYICRVPSISEYMFMPSFSEIGMYEETFRVMFKILVCPFFEEFLYRYG